jgi:antitoxin HicB
MLAYPVRLEKTASGYVVSFRDIPEALSEGKTRKAAVEMAAHALITAMDFYFEDRREVPKPSKLKKGEELIELPTSLSAKILLLNVMLKEKITPAALARKLNASPQAVTRIVDLHHATKIDTIADALNALGKKLVIQVADLP